jgi:uncharacterized protein (DUF885 family)
MSKNTQLNGASLRRFSNNVTLRVGVLLRELHEAILAGGSLPLDMLESQVDA